MKVFVIVRNTEDHYTFTDVLGVAINEDKAKKKVAELNADGTGCYDFTYYEFDSNDIKNITGDEI